MIRYILVDDCPKTLERVRKQIDSIAKDYGLQYIDSFNSSKKASEEINENSYDLLIVDFEMPVYNGIELAEKIALDKKIIFLTSTTNNEKLVINKLDISGYLSKPFEIEEFQEVLKNKILGKIIRAKNTNINIESGDNNYMFNPKDALYITTSKIGEEQSKRNYVSIYGENDTVLIENIRTTISTLSKKLEHHNFQKISQGTIVNMDNVKSRVNKEIRCHNSKEVFEISSKTEKSHFLNKIKNIFRV